MKKHNIPFKCILSVSVAKDEMNQIKKIAAENKVSLSKLIRTLINQELSRSEDAWPGVLPMLNESEP